MSVSRTSPTFGFLIHDIARLIRRDFYARVQGLSLTQAQWRTLANLARMEGCRQTDLAEFLEVKPITLARLVDRLEQQGLVERRQHPQDRRAVQLYCTSKSRPLIERMRAIGIETEQRALTALSEHRQQQLLELLAQVRGNLSDAATAATSRERGRKK
jgi:DNA-binding MarR family transcriptional regulator